MEPELTDQELEQLWDEQMEILREIGENLGIYRSIWVTDVPDEFDFNLKFTDKTVFFKNRQGGQVYKLISPTYAEVWKAFEKSLVDIGPTDHIFIENIEISKSALLIQTGS